MAISVVTPSPRGRSLRSVSVESTRDPHELSEFLPPKSDPDYLWVLSELVCDDLSQHWAGGCRRRLIDYRDTFPELFRNPTILQPIADQEYQLRKQYGDRPNAIEYREQFGLEPPSVLDLTTQTPMPLTTATIAQAINPVKPFVENPSANASQSFSEYDSVPPDLFPKVGEVFQGFLLKDILGKGSFATVYMAEQVGLSSRTVALKVTRRLGSEANRLARLQHANIVPIFSFHPGRDWQAICMPYFGRQTLDQIVRQIRVSRSLPKSGQEVFSTVVALAGDTVTSKTKSSPATSPQTVKPTEAASRGELRNVLSHLSYVDASVLIAAQIADGLVHAHSLNILHLDLKPANVLLSEHGQPMLLDFNLAFDRDREERLRFGGTIPYMAPEQLSEMMQSKERYENGDLAEEPRVSLVCEQTDLYAVGVMLFELLTGQLPFPMAPRATCSYAFGLEVRKSLRPSARALNPDIPTEIDAIIRKLLEPEPAKRYPNAMALREDLLNHLEHRPLKHVRATTLLGRFSKWRKRHPRATIKLLAVGAMSVATATTSWGFWVHQKNESQAVQSKVNQSRNTFASLRIDLAAPPESASSKRGAATARKLFERYGLAVGVDATTAPEIAKLGEAERQKFLDELHDIAVLAAYSEGVRGVGPQTETHVANWLKLAKSCGPMPASDTPRGAMLAGVRALHDGRINDSATAFETVVKAEPSNAAAQFLLGITLLNLYQFLRASDRFEMAAALAPDDARPAYNCGLLLLNDKNYLAAETAFTQAVERDSTMTEAWLYRAQARIAQRRWEDALADCQKAVDLGGVTFGTLATQAMIYDETGLKDKAIATRDVLAKAKPRSSSEFEIRGRTRCRTGEYTQALSDFRTATTLNPRFAIAWNNQAHVLGEILHETEQAIAAMDRAVEANPQNGELYLGRAVLLARSGKRDAAHKDAEKGRLLTDNPKQIYQAACAYALTSRTHPDDAEKAVSALREAVRTGYRDLDTLSSDHDLDPIRKRDDVKRILDAAKSLVN